MININIMRINVEIKIITVFTLMISRNNNNYYYNEYE